MEELLEILKDAGVSEDVLNKAVEVAQSKVDAEKEHGVSSYRKKDKELLKYKKEMEAKLAEVNEQLSAREKAVEEGTVSLESLKKEIEAMKEEKAETVRRERKTSVENSLLKELGNDFVGDPATVAGLLALNEYSQEGEITMNGMGIGDFVKGYRESNPRMFSTSQKAGGGELPPPAPEKVTMDNITLSDLGL